MDFVVTILSVVGIQKRESDKDCPREKFCAHIQHFHSLV